MSVNVYDLSAGVFVRGLSNLKAQLAKAEAYSATSGSGEGALLAARLGALASPAPPSDLHMYTLAAHVHWAAEGATMAIAQLLGTPSAPEASDAKTFGDLQQRLDATIAYLQGLEPSDLEAGLDRTIVIENRRGTARGSGRQFLIAFAIPHFFYHVTAAYSILRNQGVALTMGDFLGNWGETR